jgi:hypothetical protein
VQVDNSEFYSKRTGKKEVVTGGGDLLDDVRNNIRPIEDIKDDELPLICKANPGCPYDRRRAHGQACETGGRHDRSGAQTRRIRRRQAAKQPKPSRDSFDRQIEAGISAQF